MSHGQNDTSSSFQIYVKLVWLLQKQECNLENPSNDPDSIKRVNAYVCIIAENVTITKCYILHKRSSAASNYPIMKVITLLTIVGAVSAFAPQQVGRASTQQGALFDDIFNMDLFAPVKDQDAYGAYKKKKLATGKIGSGSYVPNGMTAAQYQKFRDQEAAKKKANYERNVKKAGVFEDYTTFYKKRGTDTSDKWVKSATRGHRMAKMKYDITDTKKYDGAKA
eukprot:scaffold658_cov91-Cylindrotheca_fusiformis.AAC.1